MKLHTYSLLAAAAACGMAFGETAYTTPVGYVTKTLPPNQFTLVGLTVHNPTVAAGVIDAESAAPNSITDNEVNFGTTLTAGATYILELEDGTVQEITSWSGSSLTTPDDITGLVTPATTKYKLRKAATVAEVFGANNTIGLTPDVDGSQAGTDFVLILNASGTAFDTVYYFNDGSADPEVVGWYDDQGARAESKVIAYPDGFFVKRDAGSPLDLVISGEVKTVKTGGRLVSGFNYLNSVAPASMTLGDSGLEAFVTPDTDGSQTGTDFVLIQQGLAYKTCYYFNDGSADPEVVGWYDDQGARAESVAMDGGFLLQSATGPKPYTVNLPSEYSSL